MNIGKNLQHNKHIQLKFRLYYIDYRDQIQKSIPAMLREQRVQIKWC